MNKKFKLVQLEGSKKIFYLPSELPGQLGLKENEIVTLNWGSESTLVRITQNNTLTNAQIGLTAEIINKLAIPINISVRIKAEGQKSFRLGPVIGILTFANYIPGKLHYYDRWVRQHRQGGLLYVFRGKDISIRHKKITGFYYNPLKKVWEEGSFPFPDVVIDRCYPNFYKYHDQLEMIMGPGKIFNKKNLISKIDFSRVLSSEETLKSHLPETRIFRSSADLSYFLNRYGLAFLKPSASMKGSGIIIARKSAGKIEFLYHTEGQKVCEKATSADEIYRVLQWRGGKKKSYIVQKAINSVQYKGGPLSFRICPMKNGTGKWTVAGLVALGTLGAGYTTNYASGGKSLPLREIEKEVIPLLPYDKDALIKILCDLSVKTAIALDNEFGPLGDLGVDAVIDTQGKPWLLEANGNTAKIAAFVENDFPAWRILTYRNPLDYASFLADFGSKE